MSDTTPIRTYLAKLNLEIAVTEVYLTLVANGPQNIMQLARLCNIERTKLYRILNKLSEHHLITSSSENHQRIISAAPISNTKITLARREQELKDLYAELETIQMHATTSISSPLTHIQMYRGQEGLRQMFWNQTRAKGETLSIMYENMQQRTNQTFFERWVRACNERGLTFRGLIGDHFIETQQNWYSHHSNERLKNWQARYAPPEVLTINHATITYDDTVTCYNWREQEIFGIELHNPEIATAQRQFFELVWQQSRPIDDLTGGKPGNAPTSPETFQQQRKR